MKVCDRCRERESFARGMCRRCYQQMYRQGELDDIRAYRRGLAVEERFFLRVDAGGICWEWTGPRCKGYGMLSHSLEGERLAHRWCWRYLVGPIPKGMTLDHLCLNKGCVNPDHLEVVTPGENARRANSRTHCKLGHDRSDAYVSGGCRPCSLKRAADRRALKRDAQQGEF